jgi:hypothetical protein
MSTIPGDARKPHDLINLTGDAANPVCISPEQFLDHERSLLLVAHQTVRTLAAAAACAESFGAYTEAASYLAAARDSVTDAINALPAEGRRADD